jgi:hypothetical protein
MVSLLPAYYCHVPPDGTKPDAMAHLLTLEHELKASAVLKNLCGVRRLLCRCKMVPYGTTSLSAPLWYHVLLQDVLQEYAGLVHEVCGNAAH